MTETMSHSDLEQRLIDRIDEHGPITFEAFMDAALYDDRHGYYPSRRRQIGSTPVGTDGDYFTSPSSHPAFGALLALQLDEMWRTLGSPDEFTVVEMGAGDGVLGSDVYEYIERELPAIREVISYIATDLVPPAESTVIGQLSLLPLGVKGCVISNELLDAMPVNRFIVQAGEVREIYVDHQGGKFVEVINDVSDPEISARVEPFLGSLPEGYRGEANLRLRNWADSVSATLERGYVITIDYGYERPELYTPARLGGSLRCYYQHTLSQNALARIGRQDITAHVDFTTVDHMLLVNGFERIGKRSYVAQRQFLTNIGIGGFLSDIGARTMNGQLSRSESQEDLAGIGSLIDPGGLGRFKVAAHSRGVESDGGRSQAITGIVGGSPLTAEHSAPTLDGASVEHARLLRASNPFSQDQSGTMPTWDELFGDKP